MALGIKKITESVIEDDRSLIMLGKYDGKNINFDDNQAVPNGAIISNDLKNHTSAVLRVKSGEGQQLRIDANASLYPQSVTKSEIRNYNVLNQHLNDPKAKDADRSVHNHNIKNSAVTTDKIANQNVTKDKIKNHNVLNQHLNDPKADDANRSVANHNIRNGAITNEKIANGTIKRAKLNKEITDELDFLRRDLNALKKQHEEFEEYIEKKLQDEINKCLSQAKSYTDQRINTLREELKAYTNNQIEINNNKYNLKNVVFHQYNDVVGAKDSKGKYTSTPINNLVCSGKITCKGDIEGRRVFFMTYQDLAEAYIPGEDLEPGDIVAIHEDGKVYKAESINDCIVGVISNEYANCFGASKEELFNGSKVAVGMIGKVHVKVKGPVSIGQKINVSLADPGIGMAWNNSSESIGKALESYDCDFDEIHEVLVQIRPM